MVLVDRTKYSSEDFELLYARMSEIEAFHKPEGKRYALCLRHAFELLGAVKFLKRCGGSVLMLHADTPLETAINDAKSAGCSYLLFNNLEVVIPLYDSINDYEPSILQFSSGTTGAPKLIVRSWSRVETEIYHYNRLFDNSLDEQPIILVPVSHSFGLITGVLSALARGLEPVIIQDKNPKFALHMIRMTSNPIVYTVPFIYNILNTLEKEQFYCHKAIISGSPPSEQLLKRMNIQTDEVWQQYGCTEVGCISVSKHPFSNTDVGTPLGHLEISIQAPQRDDNENVKGEIIALIDGVNVVETRDLGSISAENRNLQVYGRLDDLINVSGLKVIPSEVETVIGSMPGIQEVVVVKTAHKIWGEAVRALVVTEKRIDVQDIRSWCLHRLPSYKVPSSIELVREIPKLPSGKISRKLLQELER